MVEVDKMSIISVFAQKLAEMSEFGTSLSCEL